MEIKTIQKSKINTVKPEVRADLIKKLRKEGERLVKGKFEFIDAMGGWLEFNYRFFPDEMLVTYKFIHNEICEIPMALVKHLNNTIKKVRNFGLNNGAERGNEIASSGRGVPSSFTMDSRVRFTPIDMF